MKRMAKRIRAITRPKPKLTRKLINKVKALPTIRNNNKYIDTYTAGSNIDNTGNFLVSLSDCIQGTDYNQRVGRRIAVTKIEMRWKISQNTNQVSDTGVRLMLVRDKKPDAGVNDYLVYQGLGNPYAPHSGDIAAGENDRTVVLKDVFLGLGHGGTTSGDKTMAIGKMVLNMKKRPIEVVFDAASALYEKNKIALFACSSVGTNVPTIDIGCRVYFHDLP